MIYTQLNNVRCALQALNVIIWWLAYKLMPMFYDTINPQSIL